MTTPTREQVVQLITELESGSNWLSGKHNVYSYNRQPKIAAMFLKAFAEQGLPELIEELRKPHDWKLEGFGHFKDVTMSKSDAPFRAADAIESLARADLEATIAEKDAEIERLKAAVDPDPEALHIAYLHGQGDARSLKTLIKDQQAEITEQAAHIERLREALQEFLRNPAGDYTEDIAGEALSIPSSADALREHDVELVKRIADKFSSKWRPSLLTIAELISQGKF